MSEFLAFAAVNFYFKAKGCKSLTEPLKLQSHDAVIDSSCANF